MAGTSLGVMKGWAKKKGIEWIPPKNPIFGSGKFAELKERLSPQGGAPKEIRILPGLKKLPKDLRSVDRKIYFLCKEEVVIYVGQTTRPWPYRILEHARHGVDFDAVFYLEIQEHESLDELEAHYIAVLTPRLNGEAAHLQPTLTDEAQTEGQDNGL
jgi:hypothetical protein